MHVALSGTIKSIRKLKPNPEEVYQQVCNPDLQVVDHGSLFAFLDTNAPDKRISFEDIDCIIAYAGLQRE